MLPALSVSNPVTQWGLRYRAHNKVLRWAVVVAPARVRPRQSVTSAAARHLAARARRPGADECRSLARPSRARRLRRDLPGRHGPAPAASLLGLAGQIDDLARMPAILRAARPWLRLDLERVYAVGGSMGGQETLLLVGQHPTLLAGAVAFDSVTDFFRRYGDFALLGRKERALQALARIEVGGTPKTNPAGTVCAAPCTGVDDVARSGRSAADVVERRGRDRHRPGAPVRALLRTTCGATTARPTREGDRLVEPHGRELPAACSCPAPSAGSASSLRSELEAVRERRYRDARVREVARDVPGSNAHLVAAIRQPRRVPVPSGKRRNQ